MTIASPEGRAIDDRRTGPPPSRAILEMRVDATSYQDATERVLAWAREGQSRTVAVATVNNVMEAYDRPSFRRVMNDADLVTPDGMPLVWGLRLLGVPEATRVYGPDLTPFVLREAEREGVPVGFHGSSPEVLERLLERVRRIYPALQVVYAVSPPFGEAEPGSDRETVDELVASGCRILFVGLGCPKQERWMADHRDKVPAVMLGVGAAFDFLAGTKRQAPGLLQRFGLEWLFRLASEPRRLWRRYLHHNPRFLVLFGLQVLGTRLRAVRARQTTNGGSRD
jgi:N-acetylglucosaminyldiphosphoundecaprenol N-acetyl-beta-D-mannosaminyltransferase